MIGRETVETIRTYGVSDYIIKYYEALYTTGDKYIIEDTIDEYINKRKERYET